jgi:hypothetical protein
MQDDRRPNNRAPISKRDSGAASNQPAVITSHSMEQLAKCDDWYFDRLTAAIHAHDKIPGCKSPRGRRTKP